MTYIITYISAGLWGRSASGPDWHGDTQDGFNQLFVGRIGSRTHTYTMSYDTYMSVAEEYRNEIDAIACVTVTGRTDDGIDATRIPDETIVCFYGDILAKIGGWNGIDHLIVDRDDGGPNIWSSNFTVGSCNDDEIDDEIYDGTDDETDDETDDDEYEPKSELATDLSSIFGDIDTKWIIIAVIALIILGILS